ncbi:hypothetical protein OYC64_006655 [Pagothenia borchgrevinki]|uniref:Endonuclease/exonuclease/phosphatase domain-containing protein n=1 Tax=Pagothenia borchgrevinki TaxID=8213 RepID=A0ABD2GJY8_PAGBO
MRLLCALGLLLALLHVTSCLLIGAFNIRNFGVKKSGIRESKTYKEEYEEAMEIITKIVQHYDIILIQEVRDPDGKVTERLMALVNKDIPINSPHHFDKISSDYLGPSSHKERYLFLYKDQTVTVTDSFQYPDTAGDFDRPPFIVKFSSTQTDVEFVLIPIHTSPSTDTTKEKTTLQELHALDKVVDAAEVQWTNTNIMVLGDFNAGIRYVKAEDWKNIPLFTDKGFHSLINDVATTMAEKPIQTHDRIVVSDEMNKGVVKAEVFDFIKAYPPKKAKAEDVSDHFPVEVRLELKREVDPPGKAKRPLPEGLSKDPKKIKLSESE